MVYRHCRKRKFIQKWRAWRLRKTPLISERACFKLHCRYRRCFRRRCCQRGKNECFTTRDLASDLTNLILPSRPFFTLISGWNNSWVIHSAPVKNWFTAASAVPLIGDPLYTVCAGYLPYGLLLVHKGGWAAGWPIICPGEPQEDLGRGQQIYHRRDICRCVPPLVWVAQKVCVYRRWPCYILFY